MSQSHSPILLDRIVTPICMKHDGVDIYMFCLLKYESPVNRIEDLDNTFHYMQINL